METDAHLAALDREGELLLAAVAGADLDAAVPSCPAWHVRDLVTHLGFVHRWATGYLVDARTEMVEDPDEQAMLAAAQPDDSLLAWFAEGHAALVAAIAAAGEDLRCWTFLPASSPRAFWARRQAHETAIHRVDGQQAAGVPVSAVSPEFAIDGLDELLCGFLGRRRPDERDGTLPTIAFEPTDHDRRFVVHVGERGVGAGSDTETADLVLRASASDLYRLAWNRLDEDTKTIECSGDRTLIELWRQRFQVTWS